MPSHTKLGRRSLLRSMALVTAGIGLSACAPKVVETVIKETVETEKLVKETVIVEKEVEVEKVVTSAPASAEPVKVNLFARTDDIDRFVERLTVTGWYDEHPDIVVETMGIPDEKEYWTKILTMAAGGVVGSVFWSSIGTGGFQRFAVSGLCLDLNSMIEADDFDIDDFNPGAMQPLTFEGKRYGLPIRIHMGRSMIWYNRNLFAEAGVEEPTADWTFEDMVNIGRELTKDPDGDGRVDQWGFVQGANDMLHQVTIIRAFDGWEISADGKQCLLNSPEAMAALTWVYDSMYTNNFHPPAPAIEKSAGDMFLSGKVAMQQLGWWGRTTAAQAAALDPEHRFDMWCVPLPKSPSGKRGTMFEVNCISIASEIEPAAVPAAWELMKGMTSIGANLEIIQSHFGPARMSALPLYLEQGREIADYMMPCYENLDECLEFRMCSNWRSQEYLNAFDNGIARLWLNDAQPENRFFDELTGEIQEILDLPMVTEG